MAPGTRTPNERLNSESCAGLPRDLYARLAGETVARLRDVFCLRATAEADASTQPMDTEAKAFNAASTRGFEMKAKPQWKSRRRDWHGYVCSRRAPRRTVSRSPSLASSFVPESLRIRATMLVKDAH